MSFRDDLHKFKDELDQKAKRSGPKFNPAGNAHVWHDQVFERDIEPVGTINCQQALRVGATHNGLDIALIACNANEEAIVFPAGATITLSLMQADSENGAFEDVGPTICVKAPAEGIEAGPDDLVARFPIGNLGKPWLKVNLEFSGAITGGKVDCALAYMAR